MESAGSQQKRTQPVCWRLAQTAAGHGSRRGRRAKKIVFEASCMVRACTLPMTVLSSTWRSAPAEARSVAAYPTQQGEVASTMLEQIRVEPPGFAMIGPVMDRNTVRLTSTAATRTLGSPGETGSPLKVKARPGTSVESTI